MDQMKKFTAPMTLEERGALEKFKDALEDDENCDYDSDIHSDGLLLRFLRARKLMLDKSLFMFKEYLKFYESYNVASIMV
jgi:hypothetical protein